MFACFNLHYITTVLHLRYCPFELFMFFYANVTKGSMASAGNFTVTMLFVPVQLCPLREERELYSSLHLCLLQTLHASPALLHHRQVPAIASAVQQTGACYCCTTYRCLLVLPYIQVPASAALHTGAC